MLGTHIRFMAQVNKDAAKAKKQELMEAMRSLERMPQRFPFFEEAYIPTNKYHKMFVAKWYLVLYQIQDDTVKTEYQIHKSSLRSRWRFFCTQKEGAMIGSQDK